MRDFNVLFTCCSRLIHEQIESLRDNEDCANVKVYATNCNEDNLPLRSFVDGAYVVPPISDDAYLCSILKICEQKNIDIIIPTVTLELDFMAKHRKFFEKKGFKVSIATPECISVANDKIKLYEKYDMYMPYQTIPHTMDDVNKFATMIFHKTYCCKLSDHCGGNGFAIVDTAKSHDVSLFNKYGENRYISYLDLFHILQEGKYEIILQEYIEGKDYSVSVLAVNGEVTHICGYVGHTMSYGAIMSGEILRNEKAYRITEKICNELNIDGNACFDFKLLKNNDVVLLEINPRINATLPFVRKAGINMLYLRCKNLLGDYSDIGKRFHVKYGLRMKKYYNSVYY